MLPEPTTKKARKAIKIKIQESRRGKKPVLTHKAREKGAQWLAVKTQSWWKNFFFAQPTSPVGQKTLSSAF